MNRNESLIVGSFMLFILAFFSYQPMAEYVDTLANNSTTDNAIISLLDVSFPYVYSFLCFLILGGVIIIIMREIQ